MISPLSYGTYESVVFGKKHRQETSSLEKSPNMDDNPISRRGEMMKLITATFIGGLAFAGRLLVELFDNGEWLLDIFERAASKISKKDIKQKDIDKIIDEAKNKSKEIKDKKILSGIGIFVSLLAVFFCGVALLYTAFHAPKISYESKVNSFKKGKEMDVYIKSNDAERELYTQLDEKAQSSNREEKEQLKEQYLKMKNAKNQVPDFVNIKTKR